MDRIGLHSTTAGGYAGLLLAIAGLVGGTAALAATPSLAARGAAVVLGLVAGAVTFVVFRGGQFTDPREPGAGPEQS